MTTPRRWPRSGLVLAAALLCAALAAPPAAAQAPALNGSAYGTFVKVGLFGGPPGQVGAKPVAALAPNGGRETASLPEAIAKFGPAIIFGGQYEEPGTNPSGKLSASTEGRTGAGAFVTSSASVVNVGPGPLIADEVGSTCRAGDDGVSGSTTLSNAIVETEYDADTQDPVSSTDVPDRPPPNTTIEGTLDHIGDSFRIVFNEQVVDGDTITVRAVHMFLLGPIAVGEMIIGQSVCGLSADDGSTAPPTTVETDATGASTTGPPPTTGTAPAARASSAEVDGAGGGAGSGALVGTAVAGAVALAAGAGVIVRRRRRPRPG